MRGFLIGLALVTTASFASGQMDSNSITVSAARSLALEPDQTVFFVAVTSSLTTSLDQVVAAVEGSGISAADLANVNTIVFPSFAAPSVMGLRWSFVLAVPLSMMKSTTESLATIEKAISQDGSGLTLSFQLLGAGVSAQSRQGQQCPVSDLLADATAQAKKLADAAHLSIGPVLAIAEGQSTPVEASVPLSFSAGIIGSGSFLLPVPLTELSPAVTCSLTVKFTLYRYH